MQRKLFALMLCAIWMFSLAPNPAKAASTADRTILYVATDGKDSNDGSIGSPFATIDHARDTLREMKKNGAIGEKGAVVYLRGGTYSQLHTVHFTEEDSGEEGAPIVYRGYPGEDVTILGGTSISPSQLEKVTDEAVLSKLINQDAAKNLYQIDFDKAGIEADTALLYLNQTYGTLGTSIKEFAPEWAHYGTELMEKLGLPKTRGTPLVIRIDEETMELARYPDTGYMYVDKPLTQYSTIISQEEVKERGLENSWDLAETRFLEQLAGNPPTLPSFIPDQVEHVKLWLGRDLTNVLLSGNIAVGWSTECWLLKEIREDGTIVSANASYWEPVNPKDPFYIYNFFDEISANEYYFDLDRELLYLCLPKALKQYEDIKISLLETPIFDIQGVSWMDIKNIHFSFSAGEAVNILDSNHVSVDSCEISQTLKKNRAMYIGGNSDFCGIKNSYFHNVNGGPVIWGGSSEEGSRMEKKGCYLINCEIEEFSEINKTGTYAFHIEGCGNIARYNKVHGGEHQGILFGGFLNTIEFNEIYDVCRNTDDAAAVYAGQSWVPRGTVLAYNYIHDLGKSSGGASYGVHGIYLDDGFSRADVVGNVLVGIPDYGIFLGGGNGNGIYNNVLINCGGGIWCDERKYDKNGAQYKNVINNYYKWGDIWSGEDVRALFPDLENLDFDQMRIPANIYKKNVIYNSGGFAMASLAQKYGTFEDNWITTVEPGFVDIAEKDYTLNENSAAAKKIDGFMPIPFTRMGQCIDRAMERIQPATVLAIDSSKAFVNGVAVTIDDNLEITPMLVGEKTYLPIRFLAEANGFTVTYNEEDRIAAFSNDTTSLSINTVTGEAVINGQKAEEVLDVIVEHDRTFLPMRAVSEMLGQYVFWNDRGLVAVSPIEQLFSEEHDDEIIDYIYSQLCIY